MNVLSDVHGWLYIWKSLRVCWVTYITEH